MAPTAQAIPANGTAPLPATGAETHCESRGSSTSTASAPTTNGTLAVTRQGRREVPPNGTNGVVGVNKSTDYSGVKEKLRKHVEGLTKELYEQLVKKMFQTLECTPDGKQLKQNKRLNMETLKDVQSNLRGEMDQLVEDLFVPFMSQITKNNTGNVEPVELRDAKVKLRKCMDDIVRDLFGPFLNELNDLFKSDDGVNLVDVANGKPIGQKTVRGSATVANIGTHPNPDSADSRDKMELVQTIARLQRKAQVSAGVRVVLDSGEEQVDQSKVKSLRIQCIHEGCPNIADDWTGLEIHLKEDHGFTGNGNIDDLEEDQAEPLHLPTADHPPPILNVPPLRERHAQMMAVMSAPNVKRIWIDDLIAGEEEAEERTLRHNAERALEGAKVTEMSRCTVLPYECTEPDCQATIFGVTQLNKHLIHEHGIMPHSCFVCNDKFDDNLYGGVLYTHNFVLHRDFDGDYCCDHCSTQFRGHQQLKEHLHIYHMNSTISAFDLAAEYQAYEEEEADGEVEVEAEAAPEAAAADATPPWNGELDSAVEQTVGQSPESPSLVASPS